jgi:LysR family transcriptional regulator of gallate degradation
MPRSAIASLAAQLKRFRAARAVALAGSTARAAQLLHLSQSAVARAVRELELALELTLFERGAQGMLPTPAGELLLEPVDRAIRHLEHADREVDALTEPGLGTHRQPSRLAVAVGYRPLEVLVTLAETGLETLAASLLSVSQPAVHQALRQLEHLVGTRLFHRTAAGMRLNHAGELVLRRTKLALAEFRFAREDLDEHLGEMRGHVAIGTLPLSAGLLVPTAVERLLAQHHGLHVTIIDGTYDALLHHLRHADIDMIVGALRVLPRETDVVQEPLFADTLCVVARKGHPLGRRTLRGLRDLAGASWIVPLPRTPALIAFDQAFRAEGIEPPQGALQVNSPLVVQTMLLNSDRLALMSSIQAEQEIRAGTLTVLPVAVHDTARQIGVTRRINDRPSAGVRSLLDELRRRGRTLG